MANHRPLCPSPWRRHNTTIPRLQNLFFPALLPSFPPSPPSLCSRSLLCVSLSPFFQSSSSPPPPPPYFLSPSFIYSLFLCSACRSNTYMVFCLCIRARGLWSFCGNAAVFNLSVEDSASTKMQTGYCYRQEL